MDVAPVIPTVGRNALVERLVAAARAGRSTLLVGPAGVGKTHLARIVADHLSSPGRPREQILAGTATSAIPLGAVAHLVPVLAGPMPVSALVAATLERLRRRAREDGLVIVADDVDLLDEASIVLLVHLAAEPGVTILATARRTGRGAPGVADLLHHDRLEMVSVDGLAPDDTATLTAALVAGSVDPASARHVHAVTGGNPLWIVELLRAAEHLGALEQGPNGVRVDTSLASLGLDDVVAERLFRADGTERDAIELLAVAGGLPVLVLEALVGTDAPVALSAAGLVSVVGGAEPTVGLAHPLHRRSVLSGMEPLARRAALRRIVSASGPASSESRSAVIRAAIWHAELGEAFDPAALGWAAREAQWGLFDLIRRHLAGEAPDDSLSRSSTGLGTTSQRMEVGVRVASQAWQAEGTFAAGLTLARCLRLHPSGAAEMVPLLDRLDAMATSDEERAWVAENCAVWLFWTVGDREGALAGLAAAEASIDLPWRSVVTSTRGGLLIHVGRIAEGLVLLSEARPAPGAPDALAVVNESPMIAGQVLAGRYEEALANNEQALAKAVALGEHSTIAMAEMLLASHWGMMGLGRYREAAASAQRIAAMLADTDDDEGRALFAGIEARCTLFLGRPARAAEMAGDAISWHGEMSRFGFRPLLHTTRAWALAWCGKLAEARREAAEARRWSDPPRLFDPELDLVEVLLLAAEGRTQRAAALAAGTRDRAAELGSWPFAMQAASMATRLDPTPESLRALRVTTERVDGAPARLFIAYGEALVAGDGEALREVARRAADIDERLLAVEILDAAASCASTSGSWTLRTRLNAETGRLCEPGESPRSPLRAATTSAPELTRRESQVAVLAAKGWTSAAIADELGLSVRTVETHLYRTFAKLGIRAREELPDALGRAVRS